MVLIDLIHLGVLSSRDDIEVTSNLVSQIAVHDKLLDDVLRPDVG